MTLALAALAAGCAADESLTDATTTDAADTPLITITVGTGTDADTRVAYTEDDEGNPLQLTWQGSDKLKVAGFDDSGAYKGSLNYILSSGGGKSRASFTINENDKTEIAGATKYNVYYPGHRIGIDETTGAATFSLGEQSQMGDNNPAHLRYNIFLQATDVTDLSNVTLSMQSSIMKFVLSGVPEAVGTLKTLRWTAETADGPRILELKPSDEVKITFNSSKTDLTAYLSFLPDDMKVKSGGKFSVTLEGDKAYKTEITINDGKTYEPGKRYTAKIDNTTSTMEWKEAEATQIDITNSTGYNYNRLPIEIGTFSINDPAKQVLLGTGTISGGKATVPVDLGAYSGKSIWVCIPKVAKFFHTVTAEEVAANALTLPDKDGGSTLKTSLTIGTNNKAYENDWIVALYMGINKNNAPTADNGDGAIPIYWATGNLIATKTNTANSGTNTTFHIATAEETAKEGTVPTSGGEDSPYDAIRTESSTDGYFACALGDQWNLFGWGDATGVMTSTNNGDYAPSITTSGQSICGTANDIARVKLGGSWRLPSGGTAGNASSGELHVIMDLKSEKYSNNGNGRKWIYNAGTADTPITNTLLLPAAGMYDKSEMSEVLEMKYRGKYDCYWSGSSGNGVNAYALDLGANADASDVSWHSDKRSGSRSVRPVTE